MNNYLMGTGVFGTLILAVAGSVSAEQDPRFKIEAEIEIGVATTVSSDDPTAELNNAFATAEVAVEYALTGTVSLFAGLTLESVTGPVNDRAFEDMGLYIDEIGVAFNFDRASLKFGKVTPTFGIAWDAAPGFFGAAFSEDYEFSEAIGGVGTFSVGPGTLTASVFYLDDTELSRSLGTDRGRNTIAAGGVGNTGKFDNFALQYDFASANSTYSLGGSLLSAGVGDVKDQTGLAFGVTHSLNDQIELVGEIAYFDGFGGTTNSASYVTFGGAFTQGNFAYAASYTHRDVSNTSADHLVSLGLDYTFENDITLSSGYSFAKEAGIDSHNIGLSVIIPLES